VKFRTRTRIKHMTTFKFSKNKLFRKVLFLKVGRDEEPLCPKKLTLSYDYEKPL
jgi:hypothetical protein